MTALDWADEIAAPEAERAAVSCLLLLPGAEAKRLVDTLRPDDVTDMRLAHVLTASRRLLDQGVRPDPVTVLADLQRYGLARWFSANREAGVYLADLAADAPSPGSWAHYTGVVVEAAYRRRVQQAAQRLQQAAGDGPLEDLQELLDSEVTALHDAASRLPAYQRRTEPCTP